MKLAEAFAPYKERNEKRKKKQASIERLQKQVDKIDITYRSLIEEIALEVKKLIPGAFSHTVSGPFGLMSEMSLTVNSNNAGIYVNYDLHFYMRGDTIIVKSYDEAGNNPRSVNVESEDNISKVVGLMSKSYDH
jgi:hypothetical protein